MSNTAPKALTGFDAEEQRTLNRLPAAKAAILAALKNRRIAIVTVGYDGEGDDGQITGIEATSARGKPVKLPKGPFSLPLYAPKCSFVCLEDAIDAFAWAVLQAYHAGFENNEGGFGEITIDVRRGTISLNHNDRIIDVSNTLTEV